MNELPEKFSRPETSSGNLDYLSNDAEFALEIMRYVHDANNVLQNIIGLISLVENQSSGTVIVLNNAALEIQNFVNDLAEKNADEKQYINSRALFEVRLANIHEATARLLGLAVMLKVDGPIKSTRLLMEMTKEFKKKKEGDILQVDNLFFDAKRLVENVVQPFTQLKIYQGIKFETAVVTDSLPIQANELDIERIVENLLKNACEACRERFSANGGGKVMVKVFPLERERKVVIKVADNGCGIKEEDFNKIFSLGYSTKVSDKDGSLKRGLGLDIVQKMIKKNRGEIKVFSQPNVGTTFLVVLPRKNFATKKLSEEMDD
jgi:signal transduction histidine kinase